MSGLKSARAWIGSAMIIERMMHQTRWLYRLGSFSILAGVVASFVDPDEYRNGATTFELVTMACVAIALIAVSFVVEEE